jgi:hypothetical protein
VLPVPARLQPVAIAAMAIKDDAMRIRFMRFLSGYRPCVVPLTEPAVEVPGAAPGASVVPLGEAALPELMPVVLVPGEAEVSVLVEDVVVGEVVVVSGVVDAVVVGDDGAVDGDDTVVLLGVVVVVVVLLVVLLRSQPAAAEARTMAAAIGIRRFMTSPVM